ncbi:MAG TPA: T9SS type A sorting domain-containing protein [Bacteroidetes bacterium]|nr:T9SS type A sorting domain-containing protein [Bacteroidota bacterium]
MRYSAIVLLMLINGPLAAQLKITAPHHPSRVIIKFKQKSPLLAIVGETDTGRAASITAASSPSLLAASFMRKHTLSSLAPLSHRPADREHPSGVGRIFLARVSDANALEAVLAGLNADENIEYAEPDYIGEGAGRRSGAHIENHPGDAIREGSTPDDPLFPQQWSLVNEGLPVNGVAGKVGADIQIRDAWELTTGAEEIIVAILDSGIPPETAEFSGRLVPGYDFVNDDDDPTDDFGHGSNVSSIAMARGNNGHVMAGVNWRSKIMPLKILDSNNRGLYSDWVKAVIFAADSGARVLNMSVGGRGNSIALWDAINYAKSKGAIVIASMMNTNSDVPYFPAAFEHVIAVGATNNRDERVVPFCWGQNSGSNYGDHIDFVAPGEWILGLYHLNPSQTNYWCGTSQATPLVSGLVSLMLSIADTLTFDDVYAILKASSRDRVGPAQEDTTGWDPYFGWGRIDAATALNALKVGINEITDRPPVDYALLQNYPNPFNPGTTLRYRLPKTSFVTLRVFDILGREVATLVDGVQHGALHEVRWQASEQLAGGVYFYQIKAKPFDGTPVYQATKRMILLR